MEYFHYCDRHKYRVWICEKCGIVEPIENLTPHHVYGVANSDICIWLHLECHNYIQTHPAFAYEHGFSFIHNQTQIEMSKEKKSKKQCNHKTFWDSNTGLYKCQLCPMTFKEPEFGKTKEVKPIEKKSENHTDRKVDRKSEVSKMGYERQNPEIVNIAKMKTKYLILKAKIKKCTLREEKEIMKIALEKIHSEMKALQAKMGGSE